MAPPTGRLLFCAFVAASSAFAFSINRVNGGSSVLYVDFSVPGKVVPLELVRSYNSVTALSEQTGWKGAFGWGWTSPFETTLVVTPERSVLLRDGQTGNNVTFRGKKEDPKVRDQFFASVKAKYFERQMGRPVEAAELARLELPTTVQKRLKSEPMFRAEMADKLGVEVPIPQGETLSSSDYGLQTILFRNGEWVRERDGVTQIFDRDGRITRQYDRNGAEVLFKYREGARGELAEMSDASRAMSMKFTWRQGRIAEVIDNRGTKSKYTYDGIGNLVEVVDSTGQTYAYKYQNRRFPHLLTRIEYVTEGKGGTRPYREVRYDDNGLVVFHREKDGTETSYAYGRSTSDPQNQFTTKTVKKSAVGTEEAFDEYSLKSRADGSKYLYKQDSRIGGVTTVTIYSSCCAKPVQVTKNNETTKYQYYENGLLKERIGPSEQVFVEYDSRWKKPSKVKWNNFVSSYEYDKQGNLTKAANARGEQVTLKYDRYGRILEMIDAGKRKLAFRYGDNGKPVMIEERGVGSIQLVYDAAGRIKNASTSVASERGGDGRKPSNAKSQEVVQRVLGGFQVLMELLKPAGVSIVGG